MRDKDKIKKRLQELLTRRNLLKAVLALCIIVFLISAVCLGNVLRVYLNQRKIDNEIGMLFDSAKQQPDTRTETLSPRPAVTPDRQEEDTTEEATQESEYDIERRMLSELEAKGREIFADILDINPDFLGMIEIPGVISRQSYVLSHDNEEYLNTDFYGKRSNTGTIFLSMYNDRLMMDNNSVLFGHYTDTGSMFAQLLSYKNDGTFKRAPVIILDGLLGESKWIIFAAHIVEPDPWWMYPYNDETEYAGYLSQIHRRSMFVTDVDVTVNDRIITLAVCDYTYEDMRFVVHARRLRPDESAPESVYAEANENREDFVIPHLNSLSELDMKGTTVAVNPFNNRLFFFKPVDGGIERYSGNTKEVQGPFDILKSNGISESKHIAAGIISTGGGEDSRATYVAVQAASGTTGITLFTAGVSTGSLRNDGIVTPAGVGARYPAVQNSGGVLWLLYSVQGENETSMIYRQHIRGGDTQHLATVNNAPNARPLGYYDIDGRNILVWHDPASGDIFVRRSGDDIPVRNARSGAKVTLYGGVYGTTVRCLIERYGSLTFTSIDLDA